MCMFCRGIFRGFLPVFQNEQEDACWHHDLHCEKTYNENVTLENRKMFELYFGLSKGPGNK